MNIAVTSQNFRSITGHAGKARRFIIYHVKDAQKDGQIEEHSRLDLSKEQCFHEWHGNDDQPHPLDIADVLLTTSCGAGFVKRMARRNIRLLITPETDPKTAVALFLQDKLPTIAPEAQEHDHDHEHHAT